MQTSDTIAAVSTIFACFSLVVAFLQHRKQVNASRQATHEKFGNMIQQARMILAELQAADTELKRQPLMMLEEARAGFDKASECGLPEFRGRTSGLRDRVLKLSEQIEDGSQKYISDLERLHEKLEAVPAKKATESYIPELRKVLGLFERQKVKVDQQHSDLSGLQGSDAPLAFLQLRWHEFYRTLKDYWSTSLPHRSYTGCCALHGRA